jgi:extradiol dioxygenase family protein
MKRPSTTFHPEAGPLRIEQFQIAYATNDIDRARNLFQDRYGIKSFQRLEGQLPAGGYIHIELAWVGSTMYELLTARGAGSEIYVDRLPTDQFAIRHHHLGFLIHHEEEWNALLEEVEREGRTLLSKRNNPGFLQSCFVDAPELGHYLEYIFPEPAGLAFLESVPSN